MSKLNHFQEQNYPITKKWADGWCTAIPVTSSMGQGKELHIRLHGGVERERELDIWIWI